MSARESRRFPLSAAWVFGTLGAAACGGGDGGAPAGSSPDVGGFAPMPDAEHTDASGGAGGHAPDAASPRADAGSPPRRPPTGAATVCGRCRLRAGGVLHRRRLPRRVSNDARRLPDHPGGRAHSMQPGDSPLRGRRAEPRRLRRRCRLCSRSLLRRFGRLRAGLSTDSRRLRSLRPMRCGDPDVPGAGLLGRRGLPARHGLRPGVERLRPGVPGGCRVRPRGPLRCHTRLSKRLRGRCELPGR